MPSYQYRKSCCRDETILRPSYLTNEISNIGKTASLYWIRDCQYRKSCCGDQTILWPSYLHIGISCTVKTTSLYWIRAQSSVSLRPFHPVISLMTALHKLHWGMCSTRQCLILILHPSCWGPTLIPAWISNYLSIVKCGMKLLIIDWTLGNKLQ